MRRRDAWLSRKERERMHDGIAAAGGVVAWIRASKPSADEVREHHARLNAIAKQCGITPPYPDADTSHGSEREP